MINDNYNYNDNAELIDYFIEKMGIASGIPKIYFNKDPLDSIEFDVILKYIRKKKLQHIKNNNFNND